VVENEKQMVILMEWLRGGHLLDHLEEMAGQHYSEQQAAILFVQVTPFPAPLTVRLAKNALNGGQLTCLRMLQYKGGFGKNYSFTPCPSGNCYAPSSASQLKQPFCCEGWFQVCIIINHLLSCGARQLAEALEHMHAHKIIHRDIKAENIVFRDTITTAAAKGSPPVVKFIDLGMSTYYDPDYPEQGGCSESRCIAWRKQPRDCA
jgi:serine/threonine protein kinase